MKKIDFMTFFDVRALKWPRNNPEPKKLQILEAQAFSFPMIYIMSGYERIDFMIFFYVRAPKWLQNGPEPKNNYRFLKHKLSAFQ